MTPTGRSRRAAGPGDDRPRPDPAYMHRELKRPGVTLELFVAVLGASNYTFVEATETRQVADLIGVHVRAYEYFEGVTGITVPDQLKSAVARSCRYEPGLQRSCADMARHYGTAVVPARPRSASGTPSMNRRPIPRRRRSTTAPTWRFVPGPGPVGCPSSLTLKQVDLAMVGGFGLVFGR